MKIGSVLLAFALAFVATTDADAASRRLGGGQSIGKQSQNVTRREATPPANTAPSAAPQQQQQPGAQPKPATPPQPARPWAGILGGLAAGLGLAWLANSLGFGAGFANLMLFALVALVLFAIFGALMRRREQPQPAYGGSPSDIASAPRQYNPDKIGNDASARPWERNSMAFEPAKVAGGGGTGIRIGSALENAAGTWDIPAGFDTEGFIASAKRNFITLQAAWDQSDLGALRSMMTDEMLAEIRKQLSERGAQPNHTEVVMVEAKLLGIEDLGQDYMASVEFSGMIREEPSAGPSPFREVWNMTKPKDGSMGWLVAGLQALQ